MGRWVTMLTMACQAPNSYCQGGRGRLGVNEGAEGQPGVETAAEQRGTRC